MHSGILANLKTSGWLIIMIVLLGPSRLTVNVGIVLPFVVDPGIQPNEVAGKLALGQLLSITDLAFTQPNSSFRKCLFFPCGSALCLINREQSNQSQINNTCLCKGKAKTFLHRQILLTARTGKWKVREEILWHRGGFHWNGGFVWIERKEKQRWRTKWQVSDLNPAQRSFCLSKSLQQR